MNRLIIILLALFAGIRAYSSDTPQIPSPSGHPNISSPSRHPNPSSPPSHLKVSSPSGHLTLEIWQDHEIKYRLYEGSRLLLDTSAIDLMLLGGPTLSEDNPIRSHSSR